MNNIFEFLKTQVKLACNIENDNFVVETPKDKSHGDYACNAAMALAKEYGKNPRELAQEFVGKIAKLDFIETCEIAGPGFINLSVKKCFLAGALCDIDENYGIYDYGNGEKINVEYVSANPTGPLHVGHLRGAVYGDILAELLSKTGFSICREYYINDGGGQINTLTKSIYIRYRQLLGDDISVPDGCYPGEYLIDTASNIRAKYGDNLQENDQIIADFAIDEMMRKVKFDLARLDIHHDVFTSEKAIKASGEIEKAIDILAQKDLLYYGYLPEPKGKKSDDWSPKELYIFKSTQFGDSEDRAVKKPDGSYTYFVPDIAYSKNKIDRGFSKMILVLGADHIGFLSRVKSATLAVAQDPAQIDWHPIICQIVSFSDGGKPVKMSKRKGTFTTISDVLDEVSPDIVRFIMLIKKNDIAMDFDFAKVKVQSKENPIFYIQYAYSRGSSVLRNAAESHGITEDVLKNPDLSVLVNPAEIEVIKKLLEFPQIVKISVQKYEPHHIAFYLYDLASAIHSFWNMGNEDKSMRIIQDNNEKITIARLFLIKKCLNIIKCGLGIFKIKPMEWM